MGASDWLSTAALVAGTFATVLTTTLHLLWTILLYVLGIVVWPLSGILAVLPVVFSPITYTLRFAATPFVSFLTLLPRLEFGCAAFVGVLAGLVLQFTSMTISSLFGLDRNDDDEYSGAHRSSHVVARERTGGEMKRLGALIDDHSSQESDWQWLETPVPASSGGSGVMGKPRRQTSGLLAQIIHEEDDSDL